MELEEIVLCEESKHLEAAISQLNLALLAILEHQAKHEHVYSTCEKSSRKLDDEMAIIFLKAIATYHCSIESDLLPKTSLYDIQNNVLPFQTICRKHLELDSLRLKLSREDYQYTFEKLVKEQSGSRPELTGEGADLTM